MKGVLLIIITYLIGSISNSYILGKLFKMKDIRDYGSKNAGATNMIRVFGAKLGLITLFLDVSKGVLAVFLSRYFEVDFAQYIALLGVVLGHDFPFYLNFSAGKGVSTTIGGLLLIDYKFALAVMVSMFLIVLITKYVSLSSLLMFLAFFIYTWLKFKEINLAVLISFAVALIGMIRHSKNITRLIKGEENKLYIFKKWGRVLRISVIGGGSFGSALAIHLAKSQEELSLYIRNKDSYNLIKETRMNKKYLKDVKIPENIFLINDIEEAVKDADIVVLAVPSQELRNVLKTIEKYIDEEKIFVNVSKGIEISTLKTMSEVFYDFNPKARFVSLSGPSHAEEVAVGIPTTIVSASRSVSDAELIQDIFSNDNLRVYVNDDLLGVELAGATKNIIALGSGICEGRGYGDNTKAALITRGIHEITKLGLALGAKASTFYGLAGIGDLVVTCTSRHSRNKTCGVYIGEGLSAEGAIDKVGMVVEGIKTTKSTYMLKEKYSVEMPIVDMMYKLLYENYPLDSVVAELMGRPLKHEMEKYEDR